jgi:tripartite-type tricarboxylate transporter receptor subunit TctC
VAEVTGLKDFEVDSWYAVFAPAKTPDEVVQRMNHEIAEVVRRPEIKAKLLEQGAVAVSSTPEALTATVKREIKEWRAVVDRARIEGE